MAINITTHEIKVPRNALSVIDSYQLKVVFSVRMQRNIWLVPAKFLFTLTQISSASLV
jgi:hypothetical protein